MVGGRMKCANHTGLLLFRKLLKHGFEPTVEDVRWRLQKMQGEGDLQATAEVVELLTRMISDWDRLGPILSKTRGENYSINRELPKVREGKGRWTPPPWWNQD